MEPISRGGLRLGIVDDHPPILRGVLAGLAERLPAITALTAGTVAALRAGADEAGERLDLVLLDVRLADDSVPEDNVRTLVAAGWPVLLYTQEGNRAVIARCCAAGAMGLVGKHEDLGVLAEAIGVVHGGQPWLSGEWAAALDDESAAGPDLAPREVQALRLYATGLPLTAVAARMSVTPETVKEFLLRVRRKYAEAGRPAGSKTELYIRAVQDGLLPPPSGFGAPALGGHE